MQGIVYMPQNLQTGSPPPTANIVTNVNMEVSLEPNVLTKENLSNQSANTDSGIFSTTNSSTFQEAPTTDTSMRSSSDNCDTDNRSDCSSPDRKYLCPICETMLTSQHEFTLHIRSHNNDSEVQDAEKGFVCRICFKVLSSSSSLDRHVLVHSGERPFTCKYCGDTFTTNGNMHRHMRTHSHKTENYESDGSESSGSKNIEYNNNNVEKRKSEINEDVKHAKKHESYPPNETETQSYKCPVCERDDFNSIKALEVHLEDNHPDYPAKCNQCNQVFKNNKLLTVHRSTAHEENGKIKNSVVGFKDLTFVDFSSEKFPHIARYECEKNLHKVAGGLKFQCQKCSRAFPCSNALDIHEKDCVIGLDLSTNSTTSLDLTKSSKFSENDLRRADFFARLDLQNNVHQDTEGKSPILETPTKLRQHLLATAMKNLDTSKDLADIQSIISMTTNGSLLRQLQQKTNEITSTPNNTEECFQNVQKSEEEEAQDVFATEFRKMKLRGEFPCRLCTAVFPNLRALKGHNRAHLNGNNNGTYRCNMCPHSSLDKAALIRHMRTHNGDRPYECSLCNYAFTTKANCERHLRNRHAKSTREEVKKSIIYHPSEDPTNDDINRLTARDEMKKLNISSSDELSQEKLLTPPRLLPPKIDLIPPVAKFHPVLLPSPQQDPPKPYTNIDEIIHNENLKSLKEHRIKNEPISPYLQPNFNFAPKPQNVSTPTNLISKIQVKNLELLKESKENDRSNENLSDDEDEYQNQDEPMDLVLDLSKKKSEETQSDVKTDDEDNKPQDLSNKNSETKNPVTMGEILAQQLLKNSPKIDPASFYATHLALYRNSFAGLQNWPSFPINPLLIQSFPSPFLAQDPQEIKERLQRYQMCGGGTVVADNFADRLKNFHRSLNSPNLPYNGFKLNESKSGVAFAPPPKPDDLKPLSLNIEPNFPDLNKLQSPIAQPKPDLIQSPNSVKMVIKNGVLMPKQKQRRYRTERPFSCEHCSARFTLRSNMERHIKQQHPQFWSQRQRSNVGNPGRKSHSIQPPIKNYDISIPSYEAPKMQQQQDYEETKEHITDKLKYAILAQHLRASQDFKRNHFTQDLIKKEEEDDCALVIDENDDKGEVKTEPKTNEGNYPENLCKTRILEEKLKQLHQVKQQQAKMLKNEEAQDLVPVSRLLDNASQQPFKEYFQRGNEEHEIEGVSEEDEEGLVASGSTSEGNNSGTDENKSESENVNNQMPAKKKSAYSLAPNRVSCPYCSRKFPWTSSLRRHILTHTGQKPFKCSHCPLLFTTKSNCDRHLLRKHGNSAMTISNETTNNSTNYLMRNVPERPFKCSNCPSSTFSTYSNLKKHISCKHSTNAQGDDIKAQGYEAGSSEDEKIQSDQKNDWENQVQGKNTDNHNVPLQNSDLPFKCHLCEGSFGERQEALDHIKEKHISEYELLMSKNALDSNATTPDEHNHDEEEHEIRGKFPDYSNRKVICAFCMRRFWSAEDLRRHMRTHTGERPFSCDICRRRFTLKHSMLRHRKKHNVSYENDNINSDEDNNATFERFVRTDNNNISSKIGENKTEESDGNEGGDLISNLLGIRDKSILDQVLTASPDDAAKLLGVKNGVQE